MKILLKCNQAISCLGPLAHAAVKYHAECKAYA